MKNKAHRPKQIIKKGWVIYFISARTYFGIPHISQDKKKAIFKNTLFKKAKKYDGKIKHWVVFNNHYHLLVEFENGENLPGFIKETHGATSRLIGKIPTAMLLKENKIFYRRQTAMEGKMRQRIERVFVDKYKKSDKMYLV